MLVHKRNKYPIDIELFLHHVPDLIRVGVLTDSMLTVIIGFDIKGHRATSPLLNFVDMDLSSERFQLYEKAPFPGSPLYFMLNRPVELFKMRSTLVANYTLVCG
jgi:hypothetical protein